MSHKFYTSHTTSVAARAQGALAAPVDLVVLALGGWTLLCHAVVLSGGRPAILYLLTIASLGVGTFLLALGTMRLGKRGLVNWVCDVADPPDAPSSRGRPPAPVAGHVYRLAALGSALAVGVIYLQTRNQAALYVACASLFALLFLAQDVLAEDRNRDGQPSPALVLALGLCVSAFVDHVNRSDMDEAFYQAMASSLTRFPDVPIYSFEPLHGDVTRPMAMAAYRVHSFELLSAVLAIPFGVPPIRVAHVLLPALAGVLLPFFLLRLAREVAFRSALLVVVMTLCLLALDGSEHRSFGNFAMVRFFQGKALFVTGLVPVILAYGIRFGREPTLKRFVLLATCQVAAVGLTSSAVPLAPILAMLGVMIGTPKLWNLRDAAPAVAWSVVSSAYPLFLALYLRLEMLGQHAGEKLHTALNTLPDPSAALTNARGGLSKLLFNVLGHDAPLVWYLGCLLIAPAVASRLGARMAVTTSAAFLLFLGNPLLQPVVEGHLLGGSTYWRALWIIPVPMLCAVTWEALGSRLLRFLPAPQQSWITFVLFLGVLVWVPKQATFDPKNDARPPLHNLKVDTSFALAQVAAQWLPPQGGVILASPAISTWLSAMPQRAFPLFAKESYLPRSERAPRIHLERCLMYPKNRSCNQTTLTNALNRFQVRMVVSTFGPSLQVPIRRAMETLGFRAERIQQGHTFWAR